MLTGQCHCGAIQYEVTGAPAHQNICHCTMCRGTSGAPCVAWFTVARANLRLKGSAPVQYRASDHATRTFCGVCGTQLTFQDDATQDEVDVTIASLHEAARVAPEYTTFVESALPWMPIADDLPRYARSSMDSPGD